LPQGPSLRKHAWLRIADKIARKIKGGRRPDAFRASIGSLSGRCLDRGKRAMLERRSDIHRANLQMADKSGKDPGQVQGQVAARAKDSRADRLKNALRENLKRRKAQACERGKAGDAPSIGDKTSLHEDGDPDA
jgi:hypothetical protein